MRYLIPIASRDDLFPREEYHFPKPLIEIDGEPMIGRVISTLRQGDPDARFIFVVRSEDCREFGLDQSLIQLCDGRCDIVTLSHPTAGAACSALMAVEHIDDDQPLVVCNGDQVLDIDLPAALAAFRRQNADAGVVIFPSAHPRWSYVRRNDDGGVIEAAEKRVISRSAVAGFYYFAKGSSFVDAAKMSMLNGRSVDGRYFIAPVLNELVLKGLKIASYDISAEQYQSFYSPQRLEYYERQFQNERLARSAAIQARTAKGLNVVIPMAGLGSRFSKAGYDKPKPFIDVAGKPMIERVMDNLATPGARYILIARREHLEAEPETVAALEARGDVVFVPIDLVTEGAVCTVLTARAAIDAEAPLLIANCDQIVDFDCADYVSDAQRRELDGSILCFTDPTRDPKWSFARVDANGLVQEVREKVAISDLATVGLYYFSTAQAFFNASIDMISRNERVNNEFYVCPVYNFQIASGGRTGVYKVPQEAMHGIGTPPDLDDYLALLAQRA